jgi:hypothetical protein
VGIRELMVRIAGQVVDRIVGPVAGDVSRNERYCIAEAWDPR